MITKIISTPAVNTPAAMNMQNACCKPRKTVPQFNTGLSADTVSFTACTSKQIEEVVKMAFGKLDHTKRHNNGLGEFFGTTVNNVNVAIQEIVRGKTLQLTLSDKKFGDKNFAMFELRKSSNHPYEIISLEDGKAANYAVKMIKSALTTLKS